MKVYYMVQRPISYQAEPNNNMLGSNFWISWMKKDVKLGLVGIFKTEEDAGLASKPGDTITRVPFFEDIPDYKLFREEKVRQRVLSKLSDEEKQLLIPK